MADMTIAAVRAKFPQYSDLSDTELADALHSKFYPDLDKRDFYSRIGLDATGISPIPAARPTPTASGVNPSGVAAPADPAAALAQLMVPAAMAPSADVPPAMPGLPAEPARQGFRADLMPVQPAAPRDPATPMPTQPTDRYAVPQPTRAPLMSPPQADAPAGIRLPSEPVNPPTGLVQSRDNATPGLPADPTALAALLASAPAIPRGQPMDAPTLAARIEQVFARMSGLDRVQRPKLPADDPFDPFTQKPRSATEESKGRPWMQPDEALSPALADAAKAGLITDPTAALAKAMEPQADEAPGYMGDLGSRFMRGATETVAAIPEMLAIAGADADESKKRGAAETLGQRAQTVAEIRAKLADPSIDATTRAFLEQNLAQLGEGQGVLEPMSTAPVVPASERPMFAKGGEIRSKALEAFGAPDPARDAQFTSKLAEGAGNMLGMVASSTAATLMGGPALGLAVGAGQGVAMTSSQIYTEAKQAGADEETARMAARWGLPLGASEILPIMAALKFLPSPIKAQATSAFVRGAVHAFTSAGEEGLQEFGSQVAQNLVAKGYYDPERGWSEGAGEAALIGAILGGGLGTAGAMFNSDAQAPVVPPAPQPQTAGTTPPEVMDQLAQAMQPPPAPPSQPPVPPVVPPAPPAGGAPQAPVQPVAPSLDAMAAAMQPPAAPAPAEAQPAQPEPQPAAAPAPEAQATLVTGEAAPAVADEWEEMPGWGTDGPTGQIWMVNAKTGEVVAKEEFEKRPKASTEPQQAPAPVTETTTPEATLGGEYHGVANPEAKAAWDHLTVGERRSVIRSVMRPKAGTPSSTTEAALDSLAKRTWSEVEKGSDAPGFSEIVQAIIAKSRAIRDPKPSVEPEADPVAALAGAMQPQAQPAPAASETVEENGLTLVHGGRKGLTLDAVEIIRAPAEQKQGKKGRIYGGFYATSQQDSAQAAGYAGTDGQVYDVRIKPGTRIHRTDGDVTRLSAKSIKDLTDQGYGIVVGKDPRGRTEWVVIDKGAIADIAPQGAPAQPAAAPQAEPAPAPADPVDALTQAMAPQPAAQPAAEPEWWSALTGAGKAAVIRAAKKAGRIGLSKSDRTTWANFSQAERDALFTASTQTGDAGVDAALTAAVQQPKGGDPRGEEGMQEGRRPEVAPPAAGRPAAYGANNTLISPDRAAVVRERLKAKLRDQLNAGIDPEVLTLGAELAVFHIEAGVRRFADVARTVAEDLGTTPAKIRPYLRAWYNGARNLMEDSGLSIEGMDDDDAVRAGLAAIDAKPVAEAQAPAVEGPKVGDSWDFYGNDGPKKKRIIRTEQRNGEPVYLVQLDGDRTADILTAAQVEQERARDAANYATRKAAAEKAAADAEQAAAAAAERADLDGFTDGKTPMQVGRIQGVLSERVDYKGRAVTRRDLIREKVKAGAIIEEVASEGDVLMSPDETFLGVKQITKTGMDYARHLIALRSNPSIEPSVTGKNEPAQMDDAQAPVQQGAAETFEPGGAEDPEGSTPDGQGALPIGQLARQIFAAIEDGTLPKTNLALMKMAADVFGGTIAEGRFSPKDAYEALELAVNMTIAKRGFDPTTDGARARETVDALQALTDSLPTQTRRDGETDAYQQFSTPPAYAFAVNWLANIKRGDRVLEPSAGNGGIAIFAKNAGAKVDVNELSERRRPGLSELGFERITGEDAEQIANIWAGDASRAYDVVVMNPPFSAAGARGVANTSAIGARHLQQALSLLKPGGRLVAIVGHTFEPSNRRVTSFFSNLARDGYDLRANVVVVGDQVYKKYGTTYDNRLLVIDKTPPGEKQGRTGGTVKTIPELIDLLEEVRNEANDRQRPDDAALPADGAANGEGGRPAADAGGRPGTGEPVERPQSGDLGGQPGGRAGSGGSARAPRKPRGTGAGAQGSAGTGQPAADAAGAGTAGSGRAADDAGGDAATRLTAAEETQFEEDTGGYARYRPSRVRVEGAAEHPVKLVESSAMASVLPPTPTYEPRGLADMIRRGAISEAQVEAVIYAGEAHAKMLPPLQAGQPERRKGYFVGDGTGVGKTTELLGIIADNWAQGRKRHIIVTKNSDLVEGVKRDAKRLGVDGIPLAELGKVKPEQSIPAASEGILFTTYSTISRTPALSGDKKAAPKKSRLDQIEEWVGKDFDGLILFDEAHKAGNAVPVKSKRGKSKPSQAAMAVIELQQRLPNARVVYLSATGATEVYNLAFADRLGLWGPGTPFPTVQAFISQIDAGGIAAMEVVARDLKQAGVYMARSISYEGVEYERVEHALTEDQRAMYDAAARAWQTVLQNIDKVVEEHTGGGKSQRSSAMSAFWGAHQRFFSQVLTAMQMPTVLRGMEVDLKAGMAPVVQIVNTNEAATKRAMAELGEGDALEDLDITPRQILMQFLETSFPIHQFEEYTDDQGNVRTRPVRDSAGNLVLNASAVKMRDQMMDDLSAMRLPGNPLDLIIEKFGADKVAEVTGRSERIVTAKNGKKERERRSKSKRMAEHQEFQNGKRDVLVFSEAGGTGFDFHNDRTKPQGVQRRRSHYVVQAGWRADNAIQGFGRTHRTNQVEPPVYKLAGTNLAGHKRFTSSIARRLDQLGALTKGQKDASGGNMFGATDNLENQYADDAVVTLFREINRGNLEGFSAEEVRTEMGFAPDQNGVVAVPEVTQFLNRVLSLTIDKQNKIFNRFIELMEDGIRAAMDRGDYTDGVEVLQHDGAVLSETKEAWRSPETGATSQYQRLTLTHRLTPITFEQMQAAYAQIAWKKSRTSGSVAAFRAGPIRTLDDGSVVNTYWKHTVTDRSSVTAEEYRADYEMVQADEAKALWDQQYEKAPKTREESLHLITGALLPIWDRLPTVNPKIVRVKLDDGRSLLGRRILDIHLPQTLDRLGVGRDKILLTPAQIQSEVMAGKTVVLSSGHQLTRRLVGGEQRIEVQIPAASAFMEGRSGGTLNQLGFQVERIGYQARVFVPVGEAGRAPLERFMAGKDIQNIITSREARLDTFYSPLLRGLDGAKQAKANAADWKAIIAKLPGVKATEVEWTGVLAWLEAQDPKAQITREDVATYVRANQIPLEETVLGRVDPPDYVFEPGDEDPETGETPVELRDRNGNYPTFMGTWTEDGISFDDLEIYDSRKPESYFVQQANDTAMESDKAPAFESYTEEGGSNYREILLQVPTLHEIGPNTPPPLDRAEVDAIQAEMDALVPEGTLPADLPPDVLDRWKELQAQRNRAGMDWQRRKREASKRPFVHAAHFSQPNIVVHARVKDRVTTDGKRVLFVEEIQSDIASKWREAEPAEVTAKRRGLEAAHKAAVNDLNARENEAVDVILKAWDTKSVPPRMVVREGLQRFLSNPGRAYQDALHFADILSKADPGLYARLQEASDAAKAAYDEVLKLGSDKSLDPATPDTPFKEEATYTLMVRRLLQMAAQDGYDKLAWTPGYMQARRWDKAGESVVSGIRWKPMDGGARRVWLDMSGADTLDMSVTAEGVIEDVASDQGGFADELRGKTIQQLLGAPMAKRILSEEEGAKNDTPISFPDSGYAIAYDQQIRRQVDKFARRYGAQVTEDRSLRDMQFETLYPDRTEPGVDPVWSVEITPELREAAKAKQPILRTAYHGTPHDFDQFSTAYMGTGEGAQAYGWGLYFAGRREVAEYYRQSLAGGIERQPVAFDGVRYEPASPAHQRAAAIVAKDGISGAREVMRRGLSEGVMAEEDAAAYREVIAFAKGKTATLLPVGRIYSVEIPDDTDLLDWDKPLSEQPAAVLEKLMDVLNRNDMVSPVRGGKLIPESRYSYGTRDENPNARDVLQDIAAVLGSDRAASEALRDAGIPGHRYLDGQSRGDGDGSHNYVIYDGSDVKVANKERRDGQPAPQIMAPWRDAMPQSRVYKRFRAELDKLGLNDVELQFDPQFAHQGKVEADFFGRIVITVGRTLRPDWTVNHEALHVYKHLGVIRPNEWQILEEEARKSWMERYDIEARYPDLTEDERLEEAVAEALGEATAAKNDPLKLSQPVREIFRRIARFWRAVRNWAKGLGFQSPEDVLDAMIRGDFAPRVGEKKGWQTQTERLMKQARAPSQHQRMQGGLYIPDRWVFDTLMGSNLSIFERVKETGGAIADRLAILRTRIQDAFFPVLQAQRIIERQAGQALPEEMNAYLAEEMYSGRAGFGIDEIDRKYVTPIIRLIGEARGVTVETVGQWLYARHAQERNEAIAKINPRMPDGGSGMTTAEAARILAAVQASPHAATYEEIGRLIDEMREETLQRRVDMGLMTQDAADEWRQKYQAYVPLKGFAETEHADAELDVSGIGRGFTTRGPESKQALGRKSEAFNPLIAAITQAQEVVVRSEKNRVGQHLLRLAQSVPAPGLWEVKKVKRIRYLNETTGLVEERSVGPLGMILEPNELAVKMDGKEYRILFHDWRLARAATRVGVDGIGGLMKPLMIFSRYISMMNTMLDPEFVIRNFARDLVTANINLQSQDLGGKIQRGMMKDLPKALGGAWRGLGGQTNGVWTQHYREFAEAGGKISFWKLETPEASGSDVQARLKREANGWRGTALALVTPSAKLNPVLASIERVNLAIDNAVRLSAFVNARKNGLSVQEAASLAKNLTVNFNRRGDYGAAINAAYVFANAATQGTQIMFKALKARRVQAVAVGLVLLGFLLDQANAYLSDEDEDGQLAYDKLPDYLAETNLLFMLGTGADSATNAAKIWLPYGYNLFPYIGNRISQVTRGKIEVEKALGDSARVAFNAFAPINGQSFLSMITPTALDPAVEIATNTDFLGRPIRPDFPNQTGPDSQQAFKSATEASRLIAEKLNAWTGGTYAESGFVDVSPETIDHIAAFLMGGVGRTGGRMVDVFAKLFGGEADKIEIPDVPFARALYTDTGAWLDRNLYFSRRDEIREAAAAVKAYAAKGDPVPADLAWRASLAEILKQAERYRRGTASVQQDEARAYLLLNTAYVMQWKKHTPYSSRSLLDAD